MPRELGPKTPAKARHGSLLLQIQKDAVVDAQKRTRTKAATDQSMDTKTTKRILDLARKQQDELVREDGIIDAANDTAVQDVQDDSDDEQVIELDDDDDENDDNDFDYEDYQVNGNMLGIDEADQALIDKFMPTGPQRQINLSDLIMSKIQEADAAYANRNAAVEVQQPRLNPKVIEVYSKVGTLLSRYRSGPLPKPFKILPTLRDWEEVLFITKPHEWSPHAVYEGTRIFASTCKAKMAQRFYSIVLVDRVRDEIQNAKKVNYHLYLAIKKSLYKPAAFFKGFLLPILSSGTCTLREAAIIGSVLIKVTVPGLHAAAAMLKIAEMEYTGPNSLFIRILLDKKYALPFKVIDALVFHFLRFRQDRRELPVLWHQALLVFCERYKEDLTVEQKEALLELLKHQSHESITPDIRRELVNSKCRGEGNGDAMDDDVEMGVVF